MLLRVHGPPRFHLRLFSSQIRQRRRGAVGPTFPADFISVAYNPGRAVRANSAMLAASIRHETGRETVFTLATRDMNRLALQSLMLGAQMLGLENVVVVQGDPFNERDRSLTKPADDYRPTELIAGIRAMNEGMDFRGSSLREPTGFLHRCDLRSGKRPSNGRRRWRCARWRLGRTS